MARASVDAKKGDPSREPTALKGVPRRRARKFRDRRLGPPLEWSPRLVLSGLSAANRRGARTASHSRAISEASARIVSDEERRVLK